MEALDEAGRRAALPFERSWRRSKSPPTHEKTWPAGAASSSWAATVRGSPASDGSPASESLVTTSPVAMPIRAGRDAELLVECPVRGHVRLEGVRLPAGSVQRQHELLAQALAQRVGAHQRFKLSAQVRMTAEGEVSLDSLFYRREAEVF